MAATRRGPAKDKPARPRTLRTKKNPTGEDWAPRFLTELVKCGVISRAAKQAKVGRQTVYQRLAGDEAFAAALTEAMEDHEDDMEITARSRAKAKSDKLLMYFVKRRHDRQEGGKPKRGKVHFHLHATTDALQAKYRSMTDDDLAANISKRFRWRDWLEKKGEEAIGRELEMCRRDILHWCDAWAWTYDPRLQDPFLPFDLFPKQRDFLTWLVDRERLRENGLVEKSRSQGVTYLLLRVRTASLAVLSGLFGRFR